VHYRYTETNDISKNPILTTLADFTEATSSATPTECGRQHQNFHNLQKSSFNTGTPTSLKPSLSTATPSAPQTPDVHASLDELMLLSHLREHEHHVEHMEHELYIDNLRHQPCKKVKLPNEVLRQRRRIARLSQENDQLRRERDVMAEELRQTNNYFRASAFEAMNFLERKG
jgi:hypothetical protein